MIPRLLAFACLIHAALAIGGQTILVNNKPVNIIVWICPDQTLRQMALTAVSQSSDTNAIVHSIQAQVQGYRNQMWSVTAIKYKRSTADLLPNGSSSQNLCFISVDKQDTVVVIAAIAAVLK